MKNRWLLNLGLGLLVTALALIAFFRPGAKPEPSSTPLTAMSVDAVQRVRLLRPRQPEIVLEKSADRWLLTAPRAGRANPYRVNDLARLATTRITTRFPALPDQLDKFGLDRPLVTVFLNDNEIRFGAMHPLRNELYALSGGEVVLLPAAMLRAATSPLTELLSPSLMNEDTRLASMQFPGFSLRRNEQGAWTRTPELKGLSSDQVNRFVDEWRLARALTVSEYTGRPAHERITVKVTTADSPRTIEFGVLARKPETVLVRRDEKLEYHFPEEIGRRLLELRPEPEPETPAPAPAPAAAQ